MKRLLLLPITAIVSIAAMAGSLPSNQNARISASAPHRSKQAVIDRVQSVYQYLNDIRHYYLDTPESQIEDKEWESADELFATTEWQDLREKVDIISMYSEDGGFSVLYEDGLDPWLYDCFEGDVAVSDIAVTFLDDDTAQVDFKIRDAMTIVPIPMRWIMKVQDGRWRVADIIFLQNGERSLFEAMKEYVEVTGFIHTRRRR